MPDRCDWNPKYDCPASSDPQAEGDCENLATLSVGRAENWHLCDSCAARPFFNRLRSRVPLRFTLKTPPGEVRRNADGTCAEWENPTYRLYPKKEGR